MGEWWWKEEGKLWLHARPLVGANKVLGSFNPDTNPGRYHCPPFLGEGLSPREVNHPCKWHSWCEGKPGLLTRPSDPGRLLYRHVYSWSPIHNGRMRLSGFVWRCVFKAMIYTFENECPCFPLPPLILSATQLMFECLLYTNPKALSAHSSHFWNAPALPSSPQTACLFYSLLCVCTSNWLLAVRASYLTLLCLSFLICKMETLVPILESYWEDQMRQWCEVCKIERWLTHVKLYGSIRCCSYFYSWL